MLFRNAHLYIRAAKVLYVVNKDPRARLTACRRSLLAICWENNYFIRFLFAVDSISLIRLSWFTSLAPGS